MMNVCNKCLTICSVLFVVLGVLFLLQDLGIWGFWGVSWYTALFLVWGISMFGSKNCPECQAMRGAMTKKK